MSSAQTPKFLWARLRPYNPKRAHKLRRLHAFGRLWHGGSGLEPGDIPEWVQVTPRLAKALVRVRQSDRDPYSPRAFDIVTDQLRKQIDAQEEGYRRRFAPAASVSSLPDVRAPLRGAQAAGYEPEQELMDIATGNATDEPMGALQVQDDAKLRERMSSQSDNVLRNIEPIDVPEEPQVNVAEQPQVNPTAAGRRRLALKELEEPNTTNLNTDPDDLDLNGDDDDDSVEGEKAFVPGKGMIPIAEAEAIRKRADVRDRARDLQAIQAAAQPADEVAGVAEVLPDGVADIQHYAKEEAEVADIPAPKAAPKATRSRRRRK